MSKNIVKIPIEGWGDNTTLDLSFPNHWTINYCTMQGHNAQALSDEEVREALANTHSTPALVELAREKQRIVIIFDDLFRPTPVYRVVPFVLEELHAAGIEDNQISFISAIGSHEPMTRPDFVKKLGEDIVERYPVYNHNIYDNVVNVGTTSFGTPVYINRHVMSCDLKIGIGGVIPYYEKHVHNGGGKIILPGVSGIETIFDYHETFNERIANQDKDRRVCEGVPPYRVNLEEAARLAGLDMKIDLVQNNRKEIVGLFAGDFIKTQRRASVLAKQIYHTHLAPPSDIVILNTYPKEDQPLKGLWVAVQSVKPGGDLVIVSHSEKGLSHHHHLLSRFGTDYGGRAWVPLWHFQPGDADRVIFVSPYLTKYDQNNYPTDTVFFVKKWEDARKMLEQDRTNTASVAVYPYGGIQMAA